MKKAISVLCFGLLCGAINAAPLPMDSEHWTFTNGFFYGGNAIVKCPESAQSWLDWMGDAMDGITFDFYATQPTDNWTASFVMQFPEDAYSGIQIGGTGGYIFFYNNEDLSSGTLEDWTSATNTACSLYFDSAANTFLMEISYDDRVYSELVMEVDGTVLSILSVFGNDDAGFLGAVVNASTYEVPEPAEYAAVAALAALGFCLLRRYSRK